MFFLGKVFKVRGKLHGDEEKPFLDHLEDLRLMVTRIVITLLIATVGCWVFHKQLIDVMSKPVYEVWENKQTDRLPEGVSTDRWEEIKLIHATIQFLSAEQKQQFFEWKDDQKLASQVKVAGYYQVATLEKDKDQRKKWAESLTGLTESESKLLLEVIEKEPAAELGAKNNVVEMKSLKPTETFMLAFKLSFMAGIAISLPFNLWFILQFVLPGLRENEKKVMWPSVVTGGGLFIMGSLFAYFVVLPEALNFFFEFGSAMGVQNEWRIGEYISFVTQFTIIFGLAFELPVVIMALVKVGLLHYQVMSTTRLYALLGITIVAAVITPTGDMLTLSMLVVPMYFLYEVCIILAYFDAKKQRKLEEKEMAESGGRRHPELKSAIGAVAMDNGSDDDDDDDPSGDDSPDHIPRPEDDNGDDDYDAQHAILTDRDHPTFSSEENDIAPDYFGEEDEEDDYDYEADHREFGHHGGIDDPEEDYDEDDWDEELNAERIADEEACEEIRKLFGEETEEESVSESEGDEGDSDSYDDNLQSEKSDDDGSKDKDKKDS